MSEAAETLHDAAKSGDREHLDRLLEAGANIEAPDASHKTALMLAAEAGHAPVVRHLLSRGANINAVTPTGRTALLFAVLAKQSAMVSQLIASGARTEIWTTPEPEKQPTTQERERREKWQALARAEAEKAGEEWRDWEKEGGLEEFKAERQKPTQANLLQFAIARNDAETLRALLEGGVTSVPNKPKLDLTPLQFAASRKNMELVRLLLAHGADPNEGDEMGGALINAITSRDVETARLLLEAGANPNGVSMPPLMMATHNKDTAMVELLLRFGATLGETLAGRMTYHFATSNPEFRPVVRAMDARQRTTWHEAAKTGDVNAVRAHLDAGANVDARNGETNTGLHLALKAGQVEVARLLLERGADVHAVGEYGRTCTLYAVLGESSEALRLVLTHGADTNQNDEFHATPLFLCALRQWRDGYDVLRAFGVSPSVVEAATIGDRTAVLEFLREGVSLEYANEYGATALIGAAINGDANLVRLLLERGANLTATDKNGNTALHWAASKNRNEAAAVLIEHGADVNAPTYTGKTAHLVKGHTALHTTITNRNLPLARLLLSNGAQIYGASGLVKKQVWGDGWTEELKEVETEPQSLLHLALWRDTEYEPTDSLELFELLLDFGADPNVCDDTDAPLLCTVCEKQLPLPLLRLLLARGANPNKGNRSGTTPLWVALHKNDAERMQILLEAGADPNQESNHVSPLDVVLVREQRNLAALLTRYGGKESDTLERFGLGDEKERSLAIEMTLFDKADAARLYTMRKDRGEMQTGEKGKVGA